MGSGGGCTRTELDFGVALNVFFFEIKSSRFDVSKLRHTDFRIVA